jgi:hypothetical protein
LENTQQIYFKLFQIKIEQLVLCPPNIIPDRHMQLFDLECVHNFQLCRFSEEKIKAMYTPIAVSNVDRTGKQRLVFPFGSNFNGIDGLPIFFPFAGEPSGLPLLACSSRI